MTTVVCRRGGDPVKVGGYTPLYKGLQPPDTPLWYGHFWVCCLCRVGNLPSDKKYTLLVVFITTP